MSSKFLFLKINANITSLFSLGHNLKLCNIWHLVNQEEKKNSYGCQMITSTKMFVDLKVFHSMDMIIM